MASEATTFPAPQSDLRILLLGGGGREHALAYKLAQSPRVAKIFVVPGNGGTEMMGGKVENVKIPWGGKHGYLDVVTFAVTEQVDLAVPGPEQPLVDGVESLFRKGEFLSTTKDGVELMKRWYLCLWT
jgi:phosphoribosylamine--glycine ligase/phosphoribosylformylglycinamidine cyclo-ligase